MIRDAAGLVAAGLAEPGDLDRLRQVGARYAVAIPDAMRALIERPDDPIGRQFIPDPAELDIATHEHADPIGDDALSPLPGVVHRYADRALLKPLLVCPVYCRFCFRREHVGPGGGLLSDAELDAAYAWFRAHPAIREVILTGGDPLMLSPRRLGAHRRKRTGRDGARRRLHPNPQPGAGRRSRAASPRRWPTRWSTTKAMWLVVHANHASELTHRCRPAGAAADPGRARVPVLGQSVLLRGVNDSEAALENAAAGDGPRRG